MTRRRKILLYALMAGAAIAFCGCARTPEQKAARFNQRGKTMLEKKDYARALLEFSSAAKIQPKHADTYYQLGVAYAALGDYSHAVLSYQKAMKLDSNHNAARLKLAELMATSRKKEILEEVDRMADKALSLDPGSSEALRIRALAEMRLGDLEKAANSLRDAVEKSPQNVQAAVTLAATRLVQRDAPAAEAVMRKLVSDVPSAESWIALGHFYRLLGRTDEADQAVRKAAQIDPKHPGALFDLAMLQIRLKQMDEAGATLQRLAELPDPRFRDAHAMFLFNTGKRDEAIREFEKLFARHSEDRNTRTRLVMAYLATRRVPEAEKMLAGALKRNPKDTDALLLRAQLRLGADKRDEAAADLGQVLAMNPNSTEAHYWNSKVLRSKDNRRQSDQELGEVVRLAPDWLDARLELARSFREAHHPETALQYLDKMPDEQKGLLDSLIDRNWLLFDLRRDTELQALLKRALAVRRDPTFLLQQALLDMRQRQFAAARACLEEILRAKPEEYRAIDTMLALFLAENQRAASLDWLQQYVAQRPNSAPLRHMLGQWQAGSGDAKGARASYQQALALDPKYKPAQLELAKLDLATGSLGPARQVLEGLLKRDPRDAPARMVLASLEEKAGNFVAASEHYQVVLAADPNEAVALNNLASLLVAFTGNIEEALAHATKAYELAPGSSEINDTLGWIYYKKQVYQRAVPYLETAVRLRPNAIHKTHLGLCYHGLGRDQLAEKTIDEALALQPDLAEAQAAKLKVLATR